VLSSFDQVKGFGLIPQWLASLPDGFFLSDYGVRNVEIVGPQVGAQLRRQALLATAYSLAGMLIYLGFRFELDLWSGGRGYRFPRYSDYHRRLLPAQ
jgi:preprotein translocase subunit SecF